MLLSHTIIVPVSHLKTNIRNFSPKMVLCFTLELTVTIKKEALKKTFNSWIQHLPFPGH